MAETTRTAERPRLAAARPAEQFNAPMVFDVDAFHAMEARDDALIRDEILNGSGSSAFVYNFDIAGKAVVGISVIGARHLAAHYGGLKHRIVASAEKRGAVFTFTTYPGEGIEMRVNCAVVEELEKEDDFYKVIVEMTDVKTGNSVQMERQEMRQERRRDGTYYERPNYATIAQSKAYRNAVLALVTQDVLLPWKNDMLKIGKNVVITESVLEEKRQAVLRFAAANSIAIERRAVEELTLDQIAGLGDAAREGQLPAFAQAAQALGLIAGGEKSAGEKDPKPAETKGKPAKQDKPPVQEKDAAQQTGQEAQQTSQGAQQEPREEQRETVDAKPADKAAAKAAAASDLFNC